MRPLAAPYMYCACVCILPTGDGSWSSQLGVSIRLRRVTMCHKITLHVFTCIELSDCTLLVYLYGSHHSYVRMYYTPTLTAVVTQFHHGYRAVGYNGLWDMTPRLLKEDAVVSQLNKPSAKRGKVLTKGLA